MAHIENLPSPGTFNVHPTVQRFIDTLSSREKERFSRARVEHGLQAGNAVLAGIVREHKARPNQKEDPHNWVILLGFLE